MIPICPGIGPQVKVLWSENKSWFSRKTPKNAKRCQGGVSFNSGGPNRISARVAIPIWGQKDDWRWNFCATIPRSRDIGVQTRIRWFLKGGVFHAQNLNVMLFQLCRPNSGTKSRLASEFFRSDSYFSRYGGFKFGLSTVRTAFSRFWGGVFPSR